MPRRSQYLSVVIPTHNVAAWFDECLRSVQDQSYPWLEIIVVDDHSTDGTKEIIAAAAELDSRIIFIEADSRGGANARNVGAGVAAGEYLVFADGDDLIPRDAYAKLMESVLGSGSDMAIGGFLKFSPIDTWDPTKNWPSYRSRKRATTLAQDRSLIRGRACWNKLFRREFWVEHAIQYPEVPRSNDIVPMVTAMTRARSIDVVPEVVYLYRERPGASSMTARASKIVGLLSYLNQEVTCAHLIAGLGEAGVLEEFGKLVLVADGWVHIDRVLSSLESRPTEIEIEQLARSLSELLAVIPASVFNSIPLVKQLIFAQLATGCFDTALQTHGRFRDGGDPVVATSETSGWAEFAELIPDTLTKLHTLGRRSVFYLFSAWIRGVNPDAEGEVVERSIRDLRRFDSAIVAQLNGSSDGEMSDSLAALVLSADWAELRAFALTVQRGMRLENYRWFGRRVSIGFGVEQQTTQRLSFELRARHVDSRKIQKLTSLQMTELSATDGKLSGRLPRTLSVRGDWAVFVSVLVAGRESYRIALEWPEGAGAPRAPRALRLGFAPRDTRTRAVVLVGHDSLSRRMARVTFRRMPERARTQVRAIRATISNLRNSST